MDDLFYKLKKATFLSDVPGDELADKFCHFFSDEMKLIHSNFSVDNQSMPADIPSVVKSLFVLASASTEEV